MRIIIRNNFLDVFDWKALQSHFSALPKTTAPAGFQCPTCTNPIFPSEKDASPLADFLRKKLREAPWARVGLGLPLIEEEEEEPSKDYNWVRFLMIIQKMS